MNNTYKIENYKICPECHGSVIKNLHENVCVECGLIINDLQLMDSYQYNEIKNTDLSAGDQFVSIGKTIDNVCTLGSHIGYYSSNSFFDHRNIILPSAQQKKFRKLKKQYSLPIKIKNHETDYRILGILNRITQYMNLSDNVKNRSAYFYQSIKKKATNIRNHVSLIAFCIYYSSREFSQNAPISIKEICKVFTIMGHRINPKLIIRDSITYKCFIMKNEKINRPHKSEDYINRFVNSIVNSSEICVRMKKKGISWTKEEYKRKLETKCNSTLKLLDLNVRRARNPFILAGAVVYCADKLIARENNTKTILTQKSASNAMEIAEYSIRDHYVKILKPIFFP
ncbi:hypothetical protein [Candidatus Lokiarchaeum ossiferum]|uniref:hypothetical protein n=1 Tax=Candidatus Lokiarchaeum ossiferum TaxID=2951803 RepID=UPI00352EE644